jgi:hypothetical protein
MQGESHGLEDSTEPTQEKARKMTAQSIKNENENWTKGYSTYFWSSSDPFEARFGVEKTMRLLLASVKAQSPQLTYSGSDDPPFIGREVQLRFEAAIPNGNWYSLHVNAWVPRTWYTEAEFLDNADKSFAFWIRSLQTAPTLGLLDAASRELYDQRVHEAMDKEARRADEKEDPAPVMALKEEILAALRNGMSFRTSHHEGGTSILFDGKSFVCSEHGEVESSKILGTDDEALDRIRQLYDWESRKESFPHRPPELEVWGFIRRQLT